MTYPFTLEPGDQFQMAPGGEIVMVTHSHVVTEENKTEHCIPICHNMASCTGRWRWEAQGQVRILIRKSHE